MRAVILATCLVACLLGCQSAAWEQGDYTGQGLTAEYDNHGTPGYAIITYRDGSVKVVPLSAPGGRDAQK